jgi:hypothetical protein
MKNAVEFFFIERAVGERIGQNQRIVDAALTTACLTDYFVFVFHMIRNLIAFL